jgi:hypothetical protein
MPVVDGRKDPDGIMVQFEQLTHPFLKKNTAPACHGATHPWESGIILLSGSPDGTSKKRQDTSSPNATARNLSRGSMYRWLPAAMMTALPDGVRQTVPET